MTRNKRPGGGRGGHGHRNRRGLRFEALEPRIALDAQGTLAAIDPHFTLSFANEGVAIAGQVNALSSTFDAVMPTAVWHEQILRAFQTWAIHTNADIGLVADGGQAFGAPGAKQRDSQFGDIRVGAIAMSPEVGAVSVPVTNVVSGTWLADVLFNTQFNYQTAEEILAVATHEAGNVFGLEDNSDPNSPLFSGGPPTVNPPTAADIAALQALHGVRAPDSNETHQNNNGQYTDNNSLLQATELKLVEPTTGNSGAAPTIVYGDIGAGSDVDYFSIATPGNYSGAVTFDLRSNGISLLQPEVTVFNAAGQQIAHASSQVIGGANLGIEIPWTTPQQLLYVRVAGADPGVFGVGGYSLVTTFDGINTVDQAIIDFLAGGAYRYLTQDELAKFFDADDDEFFNDDGHTDDDAALGTELDTAPGFLEGTRYVAIGSMTDANDIDYYDVKSPQAGGPGSNVLTISVRSLEAGGLMPHIVVLDDDQQPLAAEIIVNGGGELIVQVLNVVPSNDYLIGVSAADPGGPFDTGNYELSAIFHETPVALQSMAQGTVGGTANGNLHTLYIGRPQLFHFVLDTGAAAATAPVAVVATIKNENSTVVATFASPPGERRSPQAVFLQPGTYTIEVTALTLDGNLPPILGYNLLGTSISDPFVGDPEDPGTHPFACTDPELAGFFCYPGDIISPDPFLWDDFVGTLPAPPPALDLDSLIGLLIGDWWSWVWPQMGVNGPPLAQDDNFATIQAGAGFGGTVGDLGPTSNVLANDIDPEGEAKVAVLSSTASQGSLTLRPDGSFDYVPDAGFTGTDRFTYWAHDFTQSSNLATVRIVVGSGLAGDFNADGVVNNDDHTAWRASFGSIDELLADGNRNGVVDTADYLIWRKNLGAALGGVAAVIVAQSSTQESSSGTAAVEIPAATVVVAQSDRQTTVAVPVASIVLEVGPSAQQPTARRSSQRRAGHVHKTLPTGDASLLLAMHAGDRSRRAESKEPAAETSRDKSADAVFAEWPLELDSFRAGPIKLAWAPGRWRH